jgi:histidinol-phosphate aminotransferase
MSTRRMDELVEAHIASLTPYIPGKPIEELRRERAIDGEIVKLASNENPLGPSPKALAAAQEALLEAHLYPDGGAFYLRRALGAHLGVDPARVIVGNGSNELLEILARTFCTPGDHVVFSAHAFVVYKIIAQACALDTTEVPTAPGLVTDLVAIAEAVRPDTRLVFLANPNNPTGTWFNRAALDAFLDALDQRGLRPIVIMDEAYTEYADAPDFPDSLQLHDRYDRIVTLRTFSKCYGLAAFRVGYGVAHPALIDYMNRVRAPFNTGRVAQAAALAALGDAAFVEASVTLNKAGRDQLTAGLQALGLEVFPSMANFVLCRLPRPGAEVFDALLTRGVIVRPMAGYGLPDCIRVSVGTHDQNARFLTALQSVLDLGAAT